MNAVRFAPLALVVLLVAGCSRDASSPTTRADQSRSATLAGPEEAAVPAAAPVAFDAVVARTAAPDAVAIPRRLVRNAGLQLVVSDVDSVSQQAQSLAVSLGGYVAHVQQQRPDGVPSAQLVLRVPVNRLDEALAALRRMAVRVEMEQQGVEDVTEQVVDLDARLKTLRSTEHELRALLAESTQRGQKLDGVMAVYRELNEIRTRIEQLEGQRQALEQMAALSTISLQLTPAVAALPVAGTGWRPAETFRSSLRALVVALKQVADVAIFLAVTVAPLVLLGVAPVLVAIRVLRRRRLRSA